MRQPTISGNNRFLSRVVILEVLLNILSEDADVASIARYAFAIQILEEQILKGFANFLAG